MRIHNPFQAVLHARRSLLICPVVALLGLTGSLADVDTFPSPNLPRVVRGEEAIKALGGNLPAVARAHRRTPDQLNLQLKIDRALAVDPRGRLLYTDPLPQGGLPLIQGSGDTSPAPLADTFKLHSKPGSSRILFLDFDGHVITGTAWNQNNNGGLDIIAPPFDTDGNPGTFSDDERRRIQEVWSRVSEDYAPFDVDVTTELLSEAQITRSTSTDLEFGTRVLISPISSYFGSYGGIAYVGVYDSTGSNHSYYQPALVFPENLGSGWPKYVAEAASHEAGHNLGLSHDGTSTVGYYQGHGSGETGWAPIMGVGYYQNLSQWSRGEYPGANNVENDYTVIQSNGLSFRTDDHGNSSAAATYLPAGTQLSVEGILETSADADVFAFSTGAGAISVSVSPVKYGPNVDLLVELRDASGTLLSSGNPVDTLGVTLAPTLSAGTYFLTVRGTGKLANGTDYGYSNYGSVGFYFVRGTVQGTGPIAPVAVAKATPQSGDAPLVVSLDGSGSFDQDGSIISHGWSFGDGSSGSGSVVSHTYTAVGTYTAVLTVTDSQGLTASQSVQIQVTAPNVNPTAVIAASTTTGVAPLAVTFSGSGSSDPDGTISSYAWNFGDGTTGSGSSVSKTFSAAGTYTVTLTVTDNRGGKGVSSAVIQVSPNQSKVLRVGAITVAVVNTSSGKSVRATVRVTDGNGAPLSGVSVAGAFSGLVSRTVSAKTDASGVAVMTSPSTKASGIVTFKVNALDKRGYTYNATLNAVTQQSITVP